ncbi:hypothetical protein HOG17_00685 [Candidatus Peregrinibacteria bacterium]|jgi:hypothetical protein|nr:hypothetical protein [Candidatus Peregrinibacteria bacterium]MBT4148632.1 hypothetical protein [Candidatus Peregrinibacteria bacterium]MBT4366233.1 hypothetical protein [Candidatus Peregrinibacteria bacterium]MBT4456037.1 hypothetical protein [Candidatus Peregrinibacteria bacterium]
MKINKKIKNLIQTSLLISPKNRKEILSGLPGKTQKQKGELLTILESEKKELGTHVKEAIQNDAEGTKTILRRLESRGKRRLNNKIESIDREKEGKDAETLLDELNQV